MSTSCHSKSPSHENASGSSQLLQLTIFLSLTVYVTESLLGALDIFDTWQPWYALGGPSIIGSQKFLLSRFFLFFPWSYLFIETLPGFPIGPTGWLLGRRSPFRNDSL